MSPRITGDTEDMRDSISPMRNDDKIAREAREKEARPKRPRPEARTVNHSQEISGAIS